MWMTDYMRAIKRVFRDKYGFTPTGGTKEDPTFDSIPDGDYPMNICGKTDHISVKDGKIKFCNFEEE